MKTWSYILLANKDHLSTKHFCRDIIPLHFNQKTELCSYCSRNMNELATVWELATVPEDKGISYGNDLLGLFLEQD